jgi:RNA polymerase sigma factor for flagellar operon FliA
MSEATGTFTVPRPKRRVSTGERRRNDYVTRYYHCVEKIAKILARRLPASIEFSDLLSSGAVGLIEAAARFDPARGESFEAFAKIRIRGAMLDDIRVRDTLSRDMRRTARAINRSTGALSQRLGRAPNEQELADDMGMSLDELRTRRTDLAGARVLGLDDVGPDLLERVADEGADDPQEQACRRELLDRLANDISALPERMQQVLSLYYKDNLSLREIGIVLGVTECRVCQIHGEAMKRLRRARGADGQPVEAGDSPREAA